MRLRPLVLAASLAVSGCSGGERKPTPAGPSSGPSGTGRTASPTGARAAPPDATAPAPPAATAPAEPSATLPAQPAATAPAPPAAAVAVPGDDEPCRAEVADTAEAFKVKLAEYAFPEKETPHCRVSSLRNETDRSLNVEKLTNRVREVVETSKKLVLMTEATRLAPLRDSDSYEADSDKVLPPPPVAGYVLQGRVKNTRTIDGERRTNTITVRLELVEKATGGVVVSATKEFRYSK